MNLFTECLDASQVDLLLHGSLTPEEYEAAQNHVELCETCRARVEATIGPPQWWTDVQSVLLSSPTGSFSQRHALSTDTEPDEPSTTKLLDQLGPTDDPNMLGRIGPYEIIGLLGRGGMGAVFKGFDRSLNRFVAIKMLLPHLAASGAARKRFAREGQAVAAVVDDHVMAIHCVDEWQGVPYLVMTYSRGVSLQKRLNDNGPLEVREILRIGMQSAKGLAAAHAQGIVHRDIKPANIFLDQNVERVQLMDFGLARAVDDASLTRTGVLAGTPQYMSPEQARAEAVDYHSDLFSLGSVMYAMCTGHAPFRAESSYSVLRLITDKEPRPIREINPDVPEWLCTIITKLMAKQASERYQSAKEVSELLEDCLAHVQQPAAMPLPVGVVAPAPTKSRRPPNGKLIAAAAFAFALVFAGVFVVLELNKGTLTIQSDADDVRVRITHGDEVISEPKVSKSGQSVRIAAGEYKVELVGETDGLEVENGQVTLHRAGTEVVRIVHKAHSLTEDQISVAPDAGPARITSKSLLDRYFLRLKFYEKREDSIKCLWNPTLAVVDEKPFTYTSGGEVNESFSGCKLNGTISSLDDSTAQASLQIASGSEEYEVNAKLNLSEIKTMQLDRFLWLDLSVEPQWNGNGLKLSAEKHSVVSSLVPTEVTGTGSVTTALAFDPRHVNTDTQRLLAITIEKTVEVVIPLDATLHSSELMEANVGHGLLGLLAYGNLVRSEDGTVSQKNALYACDCRLQSYKADIVKGNKVWSAKFMVPLAYSEEACVKTDTTGPSKQYYEQRVCQEDIDRMLKDGVQFRLNNYLGRPPEAHLQPILVGESITTWTEAVEAPSRESDAKSRQALPAKEEMRSYPVQEISDERSDLSTPQATLSYIHQYTIAHPDDIPVECYTSDALDEMSGVMLQQLIFMSALSQVYSNLESQIHTQRALATGMKGNEPIFPNASTTFSLKVDAFIKQQSLTAPPEECKKAFETLTKLTVATLGSDERPMQPDRELYRLAAGTLCSPKEFLPRAGQLSKRFNGFSSDGDSSNKRVKEPPNFEIKIDGDKATAVALVDNSSSRLQTKFKLRRVNECWLVSESLSDDLLTQMFSSMSEVLRTTRSIETEFAKQSKVTDSNISPDKSKVISELPASWNDLLGLLPETGTALVMFSDQPEIRQQMAPIAKRVAKEASIQLIEILQTASRANALQANHAPSTHYLLMKDRQVVDTRYGVLTQERLQEFVAKANDWLTPRSTGVEENSLLQIDCYIYPGDGKVGTHSGDAYPVTAAVVAVHEDQALLLGPNSVAEYMEKGYACVAVVRDADGMQKQLPLKVLLNGPVKLLGRNGEPHRFQASVRITHSDGTASDLPISSILPSQELTPQPLKEYDVASAIYCLHGVQGLKAVKLAALGETIAEGERVLSGSFSQKPIVPVVLGINPPMQWQAQTVTDVGGVTGGNAHGPETFSILCPSLPVPSGFTFNERGSLIGKRVGGNPTQGDMRHDVFKSHATHSILRAALDKIDEEGLKAALMRTLGCVDR